jgi:hypothetical protein
MVPSRHRDNHWIAMDGQLHSDLPVLFPRTFAEGSLVASGRSAGHRCLEKVKHRLT